MQFSVEVIKGCKRLWVVMRDEKGEFVDALPMMRLILGMQRRYDRKCRRLMRIHAKLKAMGKR